MLRHIGLMSLAMTACAVFMPINVNAATLRMRSMPRDIRREIAARPGDLIDIIFTLTLDSGSISVIPKSLAVVEDSSELSVYTALLWLVSPGRPISYVSGDTDTDIARITYEVENPVRDRRPDVTASLIYDDNNVSGPLPDLTAELSNAPDVVPVPEPLTMFGTATALGYGVIFKRKYSKKKKS